MAKVVIKPLHWQPLRYPIIFKICIITFKHLRSSNKHIYIRCSLLQDSLDSFDHLILIYLLFPLLRQINVGTRAFLVAAPTLWNSLPVSVKCAENIATFRRKLKNPPVETYRSNPTVYNWNCLSIRNYELGSPEDLSAVEVFYIIIIILV